MVSSANNSGEAEFSNNKWHPYQTLEIRKTTKFLITFKCLSNGNVEISVDTGVSTLNFLDNLSSKTLIITNKSTSKKTIELTLENNKIPLSSFK